jgi:uncharacterized membrane protein YtjA (UPF0391 family)
VPALPSRVENALPEMPRRGSAYPDLYTTTNVLDLATWRLALTDCCTECYGSIFGAISVEAHLHACEKEVATMLYYVLVSLTIAILAGILGFGAVVLAAAGIAKIPFLFLVAFLASLAAFLAGLVMHAVRRV